VVQARALADLLLVDDDAIANGMGRNVSLFGAKSKTAVGH
jgi:hypothetical protein